MFIDVYQSLLLALLVTGPNPNDDGLLDPLLRKYHPRPHTKLSSSIRTHKSLSRRKVRHAAHNPLVQRFTFRLLQQPKQSTIYLLSLGTLGYTCLLLLGKSGAKPIQWLVLIAVARSSVATLMCLILTPTIKVTFHLHFQRLMKAAAIVVLGSRRRRSPTLNCKTDSCALLYTSYLSPVKAAIAND